MRKKPASNKPAVSRETAEVVLQAFDHTYDIKPGSGPNLREHGHEGLPPGCWSIDREHGGRTWNHAFSVEFGLPAGCEGPEVAIKPIRRLLCREFPRLGRFGW
jgi:hypothetical protein